MEGYKIAIVIVVIFCVIVFVLNDIRMANNTFRVSDKAIEEKRNEIGNIKLIDFEGTRTIYPIDVRGHYVVINEENGKAKKVVVYLKNKTDMEYINPEEVIIKEVDGCKPSICTYMLIPQNDARKYYNIYIIVIPKDGVLSHIN